MGSSNNNSIIGVSGPPVIKIKKTSNVASTTAPAIIAYKIVVTNDKWAGYLFKGILTDTLYSPSGKVMSNRSWDLDTVFEGDEITLTYNAEFEANIQPGLYKNVARVTGIIGNPNSIPTSAMTPVEVVHPVQISANGMVLGTATSTIAITDASLKVSSGAGCAALLVGYLRMGGASNSAEVLKLQTFLNTQGSRLPVTGFFGPMTASAVSSFQRKYASEILTPLGLSRPTGSVYASTQRKINTLACGGVSPTLSASNAMGTTTKSIAPQTSKKPAKKTVTKTVAQPAPAVNKSAGGRLKGLFSRFFSR